MRENTEQKITEVREAARGYGFTVRPQNSVRPSLEFTFETSEAASEARAAMVRVLELASRYWARP